MFNCFYPTFYLVWYAVRKVIFLVKVRVLLLHM